jgi:hypothetical protein
MADEYFKAIVSKLPPSLTSLIAALASSSVFGLNHTHLAWIVNLAKFHRNYQSHTPLTNTSMLSEVD